MPATGVTNVSRMMADTPEGSLGGVSPIPIRPKGKVRRFLERCWYLLKLFMVMLSTIGTALMLVYQIMYSWEKKLPFGYDLPWGWADENAWIGGFIMLLVYIASKIPHLWGQQPGDVNGLTREVFLGMVNVLMVVVFLTAANYGQHHPVNAIGIAIMHLVGFLILIVWQIQAAMRLTARTWTDQSGSV
jgi:hypothetical protein